MDCEYILFWNGSEGEKYLKFHAATLEEAVERAERVVTDEQTVEVSRAPFAPINVEATLYLGFREFQGQVVRKKTRDCCTLA